MSLVARKSEYERFYNGLLGIFDRKTELAIIASWEDRFEGHQDYKDDLSDSG